MVRSCQHHERYNSSTDVQCGLLGNVAIQDCSGCKSFLLKPQKPIEPTIIPHYASVDSTTVPAICKNLGTKLGVAPCCGQMFACKLHKGKKCTPVGIAKEPFLSCSTCPDFERVNLWADLDWSDNRPRVGFISTAYMEFGGTETFHRTLIPRLKVHANVIGFVATGYSGGDGAKLGVTYATGIEAARDIAAASDIVVTWGINDLKSILPVDRPQVIAVHHADMSSDWSNTTILRQFDVIDSIVCVNPDVATNLKKHGKPVHYIPNAVDPERIKSSGKQAWLRSQFGIPEASRIVLFGHRMSTEKRPELAVDIARNLPHDWMMVIAGDGSEKQNIDRLASGCDRIRVVGHCENLADWLSISDCFLSLSTFEGFGLSVCEAMAAGVPVVSTPTGIASGLAITLPTESTSQAWADAIVNSQQVATPEQIADMFSIDRMVAQWVDVLK